MARRDSESEDEVIDGVEQAEDTEESPMSDKDKQKRVAELKAELADLEGDGPLEGASDADIQQVAEDIEDSAEEISSEGEADTGAAEEAAEEIATTLERKGITLTDKEVKGIADRISERVIENIRETANPTPKTSTRKPDKRPKDTHWSQRRIIGRRDR